MAVLDFTQLGITRFEPQALDTTQLQQLPFLPSVPFYGFTSTIDGTVYNFNVRWNTRDAAWYFDLLDAANSPILSGIKILLGVAMGRRCEDPRFPAGFFVAADLLNSGVDAGIDDLGNRIAVYFYPYAQWFANPAP